MPVLRQITTCVEPATVVIERRSRKKKDRAVEYRLQVCDRHRWLTSSWPGTQLPGKDGRRCGTVLDHRNFDRVVESHADEWIRPLGADGPQDHNGDIAAALRAAHGWLTDSVGDWERRPREIEHALVAVLDHAARLAEAMAACEVDAESGQAQLMAALTVGETIAVTLRGA